MPKGDLRWRPFARNISASVSIDEGAVLELNSFSSVFCRQLAEGKAELDCIGLCENEREHARLSKEKGTALNVTYRIDAPTQIRYPSETFDLILSVLSNRLSDLNAVLEESYRILSKDGVVLFYLLNDWSALSQDWLGVRRLRAPLFYRQLRKDVVTDEQQSMILDCIKRSPFGGGNILEHGPFTRLELRK